MEKVVLVKPCSECGVNLEDWRMMTCGRVECVRARARRALCASIACLARKLAGPKMLVDYYAARAAGGGR